MWPPNGLDLSTVDYKIWELMQERVYKTPVEDTSQLKQHLIDTWSTISKCIVDDAINQWRTHMRGCKAKGHCEQYAAGTLNRLFSEPPTIRKNVQDFQFMLIAF